MSFYIYTGEGSNLCKPDLNGSQSRVFTNTLDSLAFTLFLPATVNLNWIPQLLSDPNTSASFSCHPLPRMPGKICPSFIHTHALLFTISILGGKGGGEIEENRSSASFPLVIGQRSCQKHKLNKTHPWNTSATPQTYTCSPPNTTTITIISGSNMYPINRSHLYNCYIYVMRLSPKPSFEGCSPSET